MDANNFQIGNYPFTRYYPAYYFDLSCLCIEMWRILLIFRVFEGFFCSLCLAAHVVGFMDRKEPLPHELLFCGTFFGYLMLSVLGAVTLIIDNHTKLIIEAGIALSGFVCFMADSFVSMHHSEKDFHLMYKTNEEEAAHFFFRICRIQSALALITAGLYLVHTVLLIDLLVHGIRKPFAATNHRMRLTKAELDLEAQQPFKLHMFCVPVYYDFWNWLKKRVQCCWRPQVHSRQSISDPM